MNEKQEAYLSEKEHEEYFSDISKIITDLIGKVICIADKHNVDRDNAMRHFAELLSAAVQYAVFADYGKETKNE